MNRNGDPMSRCGVKEERNKQVGPWLFGTPKPYIYLIQPLTGHWLKEVPYQPLPLYPPNTHYINSPYPNPLCMAYSVSHTVLPMPTRVTPAVNLSMVQLRTAGDPVTFNRSLWLFYQLKITGIIHLTSILMVGPRAPPPPPAMSP